MSADVRELTARVEALLAQFEPRDKAEELVRALVGIYGEGLGRIVNALTREPGSEATIERLCADPFVASLLLVHDLHPTPLRERVEGALDSVRAKVRSAGGEARLVSIDGGIVTLELSGSAGGCSASGEMLKRTIDNAIFSAAPEVLEVRSESVNADLLPKVLSS